MTALSPLPHGPLARHVNAPRAMRVEAARPGVIERLIQRFEPAVVLYTIAASAGALGFIDIIVTGDAYIRDDSSLFSRLQWPVLYVAFLALAWINGPAVVRSARIAWPVLLWPALAWLSIAWSVDPVSTAGQALRFSMTVLIGILIGSRFSVTSLLRMVFAVTLAGVGLSVLLALAHVEFAIAPGGDARGIYFHKNMLGGQAVLLFTASVILMMTRWRIPVAVMGGIAALLGVGVSGSATAVAVTALLALSLPFLAALALRPLAAATMVMTALFLSGLIAVVFAYFGTDPFSQALILLDRDPTMTGRSDLWDAGFAQFQDRPWLGAGFAAFWTGAADWRTQLVLNELGDVMHFHNTFLEVAVQLGLLGLGAFVAVLLVLLLAGLGELLARKHMVLVWPTALWLLAVIAGMAEVILFTKHALFQILFVAIFTQVMILRAGRGGGVGHGGAP